MFTTGGDAGDVLMSGHLRFDIKGCLSCNGLGHPRCKQTTNRPNSHWAKQWLPNRNMLKIALAQTSDPSGEGQPIPRLHTYLLLWNTPFLLTDFRPWCLQSLICSFVSLNRRNCILCSYFVFVLLPYYLFKSNHVYFTQLGPYSNTLYGPISSRAGKLFWKKLRFLGFLKKPLKNPKVQILGF